MTDYEHGKLYVYDATTQTFDPPAPMDTREGLAQLIGAKAREYAGHYTPHSDGWNTFLMFAEWVEGLPSPPSPELPAGGQMQAIADYIYEETTKLDIPVSMTACLAMSKHILSAFPARAQHADWQTVPKEPTKEMIQACIWALDRWREKNGNVQGYVPPGEKYQVRWRAMLAAAPAASAPHAEVREALDARRYRRLQVLGCAPAYTSHLENGNVLRFSNLDEFVDADIFAHPSRGEAALSPPSGSLPALHPTSRSVQNAEEL